MKLAPKYNSNKQLKVGIWCAYHITLEQSEGIGVFAHNLARGLASLPSPVSVTMVAKRGDEALMANTVKAGGGRIQVKCPRPMGVMQAVHEGIYSCLGHIARKLHRVASHRFEKCTHDSIGVHFKKTLCALGFSPEFTRRRAGKVTQAIAAPLLALVFLGSRMRRHFWNRLMRRSAATTQRCQLMRARMEAHQEFELQEIIDACDVWLIPYVGLDRTFSKPTVVTIHDLVCYHFPEVLDPQSLMIFKRLAEEVSGRSTISACMSNFIRDNDLFGVLDLPKHKVRVVQPAAPSDFGTLADAAIAAQAYPILGQKYIFYPAAFRAYKNHELLVKALQEVRGQGIDDLHLVFTGIHAPRESLVQLIQESGVEDRVHILGKVERDVLALLYRQAFATIVPSRYEQGSFPLMEAMYWECPIACSRIPSLTELFSPLGETMPYFDPDDVSELAAVIQSLLRDREGMLAKQQANRDAIFGRSWTDAADDWKQVLEDAIQLHWLENAGRVAQTGGAAA